MGFAGQQVLSAGAVCALIVRSLSSFAYGTSRLLPQISSHHDHTVCGRLAQGSKLRRHVLPVRQADIAV